MPRTNEGTRSRRSSAFRAPDQPSRDGHVSGQRRRGGTSVGLDKSVGTGSIQAGAQQFHGLLRNCAAADLDSQPAHELSFVRVRQHRHLPLAGRAAEDSRQRPVSWDLPFGERHHLVAGHAEEFHSASSSLSSRAASPRIARAAGASGRDNTNGGAFVGAPGEPRIEGHGAPLLEPLGSTQIRSSGLVQVGLRAAVGTLPARHVLHQPCLAHPRIAH